MSLIQIASLSPSRQQELFLDLRKIYSELDQALASLPQPCTACGQCCNFEKTEHRLYATSLELALLLEHHPNPPFTEEDRCPYQIEGKCSVRHERMIGCRTFFRLHTEEAREKAEAFYAEALAKVKNLYKSEGLDWEYRDLMSLKKAHNHLA
jgi:Fe-S-cluster containining protein